MSETLEFGNCYYRPSFFRIKIDLPVDLSNLMGLTDATLSLYLHEYVHFIQDISTIYGLMNISTITFYIHDVAHNITKQDKEFEVPIDLKSTSNGYGYKNFQLRPHYIGASNHPKRSLINLLTYNRNWIEIEIEEGIQNLEIVQLEFKDLCSDQVFSIDLGGNLICECMAYLAEQHIYGEIHQSHNITVADEYPYMVAFQLAQKIYPEFAKNRILIIAACDASLMTYHPGLSFVRLLEHLKEIDFLSHATGFRDLYDIANNLLKGGHVDFATLLETVRKQIKSNFNADILNGNNEWIDLIFDRIKEYRSNVPEFITDILVFGDLKSNDFFGIFHSSLGSPLIVNDIDEANIYTPKGFVPNENFHPGLFWAINQMLRVFSNSNPVPCELKQFCIQSKTTNPDVEVDERCDSAPWSRATDKHLCPFGMMWRHWGLTDKIPIPQGPQN